MLKTFLVIAQGNSFSETSRKLSMRQSTVSDHVRRLEHCLGRQLFIRDTHSVSLTPEGETLIAFATTIIETGERAERHFAGIKLRGRVRFGASEDLVLSWLPSVLKAFTHDHPEVDLEITIGLSSALIARYEAGDLDVVLCKRWPGEQRGEHVWSDDIVWVGAAATPLVAGAPLPLILYPPPSMTRSLALGALGQVSIAVADRLHQRQPERRDGGRAGRARHHLLMARKLVPPDLVEIAPNAALPPLGTLDFILLRHPRASHAPIGELSTAIIAKGTAV